MSDPNHEPIDFPPFPDESKTDIVSDSIDPKLDASIDRIDAIFQATASGLSAMKNSALNDLASLQIQLKQNQEESNKKVQEASDIQKKLAALQQSMQTQKDLLETMPSVEDFAKELDVQGSLNHLENLSLDSLLSQMEQAGMSAPEENPSAAIQSGQTDLSKAGTSASGNTDFFSDFLQKANAFAASFQDEPAPSASIQEAEKAAEGSPAQKSTDPAAAKGNSFLSSIQAILDSGSQKAREIEEEFAWMKEKK